LSAKTFDYDVAIVGYGPTGVTAANILGYYGIRTLVIERDKDVFFRARAVTVDATTLRLYQALGLDDLLKADMDRTPALRWKTYAGLEFLRVNADYDEFGQPFSSMIYQPAFETTLRKGVERFSKIVHLEFGAEFTGLTQDDDGVTLSYTSAPSTASRKARVRYLIGADGGSSNVRRGLGIENLGTTKPRTWVVVDARVITPWPDRELLTFWSDPERPVVDIPLAMGHHRWEIPLREDENKEDFEGNDIIWKLIAPLGVTPDNVEILHRAFYSHHVRQAESWRDGKVILAGDAVHLMPPWAGQGMQSGIRDAGNIAWRLRSILQFGMSDQILSSYQAERQPHVMDVTRASIGLGKLIEVDKGPMRAFRDRIIPLVRSIPVIGKSAFAGGTPWMYVPTGFLTGEPDKKNALGLMIPQPRVTVGSGEPKLFDTALDLDFAVLGYDVDPREVMSKADQDAWAALGARFITIRPVGSSPADGTVIDLDSVFGPWFRKVARARVVVVRPDRLVAAADPTGLSVPLVQAQTVSPVVAAKCLRQATTS
jgi:3-(3-hydroxy-phenyl)propionate hydroxylase